MADNYENYYDYTDPYQYSNPQQEAWKEYSWFAVFSGGSLAMTGTSQGWVGKEGVKSQPRA